jgi:integrase
VAVPYWVKQSVNLVDYGCWHHQRASSSAGLEIGQNGRNCARGLVGLVGRRTLCQGNRDKEFGPHDLRRTCAKLCRKRGGDLEQIKFLLGHSSIQATERYLGSEQEIAVAVNDRWSL